MEEKGKTEEAGKAGKADFPRLHGFPDFPNKNNYQLSIINCQLSINN